MKVLFTLPKPIMLSFYEVDILKYHNHLGHWIINLFWVIPKPCRKKLLKNYSNFIQKLIHNHSISNGFIEWHYQSKIKTWNYIFHGKNYGFIEKDITIDCNTFVDLHGCTIWIPLSLCHSQWICIWHLWNSILFLLPFAHHT